MIVAQGVIRKISVGDLKNGITYIVGQVYVLGRKTTITAIRLDVEGSNDRGCSKYDILVLREGDIESRIWKSIENMPVVVEYELEPERDVEA